MREERECLVCLNAKAKFTKEPEDTDYGLIIAVIDCPACGRFKVTDRAEPKLRALSAAQRSKVSQWIQRESTPTGEPVRLDEKNVSLALS